VSAFIEAVNHEDTIGLLHIAQAWIDVYVCRRGSLWSDCFNGTMDQIPG
jgi:hypothetical protein